MPTEKPFSISKRPSTQRPSTSTTKQGLSMVPESSHLPTYQSHLPLEESTIHGTLLHSDNTRAPSLTPKASSTRFGTDSSKAPTMRPFEPEPTFIPDLYGPDESAALSSSSKLVASSRIDKASMKPFTHEASHIPDRASGTIFSPSKRGTNLQADGSKLASSSKMEKGSRLEVDNTRLPTLKPFTTRESSTVFSPSKRGTILHADNSSRISSSSRLESSSKISSSSNMAKSSRLEADHSRFASIRPASQIPALKAFTSTAKSFLNTPLDVKMAARQTQFESMSEQQKHEQGEWAKTMIKAAGVCPEGWEWERKSGGYQCERGGHGVTDDLLSEGLGGVLVFRHKNREERWAAWGEAGEGAEGPYYPHPDAKRKSEYWDPQKKFGVKSVKDSELERGTRR